MTPVRPDARDEQVLILAPLGRDAAMTASLLGSAGVEALACADAAALAAALETGAGLVLTTQEAVADDTFGAISAVLARQPPWSDVPLLVFASSDPQPDAGTRRMRELGNVTLLERPIRVATLLSVVDAALRARRRQYDLRGVLRELEGSLRQRDEFLAMLGHELRNPLAAITTSLDAMDLIEPAPAVASRTHPYHLRSIVQRQARTLSRLVDDLLEVSRVTSGKITLQRTRFDLKSLVRRCLEAFVPSLSQHGLSIRVIERAAALWVDADATRIEQVVSNLLGNAVKYTPRGGTVELELCDDRDRAVLVVRDTGVGIDAETLPGIFDLFRQADRTLNRAQGGLGIGLTLVRSLVELHGGDVVARSAGLGHGSEFLVRLPKAPTLDHKASGPSMRSSALVRRRVFVVEDHADNRDALVLLLEQLGQEVDWSDDGQAAVARILERPPDLALVDIGLPSLNGYEVARRVRAVLGAGIVLIALTGYGQKEDELRALEAGFDAHVTKPVDLARLRRLLVPHLAPSPEPASPAR